MNDHRNRDGVLERWLWMLIHTIRSFVSWLYAWVQSLFSADKTVLLDTGLEVRVGRQIAEGGFSYVFEATSVSNPNQKYALKRLVCGDDEMLQGFRKEAKVHRSVRHENLMPLLGMTIQDNGKICYMLFPFRPHSLRGEVNQRIFGDSKRPFPELEALQLFLGIAHGVEALHNANYTHRDVKLENVLLKDKTIPVLMDFGSVGPLVEPIPTRRDVLHIFEEAAQHTTLPYRPPELLEGGVRAGDADLDYTKVDVWSLGCTLFAIMYGASPFEVEFRSGQTKIVDCGQLRILGDVPQPLFQMASWYSMETFSLVKWMLTKDRLERPDLHAVITKVEQHIVKLGGSIRQPQEQDFENPDSDLDDLLGNRDFV